MTSTVIASLLALPLGFLIARYEFPGKRAVQNLLRTALALPTVVVGLLVYAFVARNAPLGEMQLFFTPDGNHDRSGAVDRSLDHRPRACRVAGKRSGGLRGIASCWEPLLSGVHQSTDRVAARRS